jgi:hypothetical protein
LILIEKLLINYHSQIITNRKIYKVEKVGRIMRTRDLYPSDLREICTLYEFIDGKNRYAEIHEGKFLEHKKGDIIYLDRDRVNSKEDGIIRNKYNVVEVPSTKVREGNYKIISIKYFRDFGRLRKDYTLKRKRNLISILKKQ